MIGRLRVKPESIKKYFFREWGLWLICLLLLPVILTAIKPGFFVVGWDNFSASLDPWLNLKRTFWATWRAYRGLGVPSDSEVVDVFRQVFFVIFSLFFKKELLEQLYLVFCLVAGSVAMFYLAKVFLARLARKNEGFGIQAASFLATFFYLFNLNTLATFYFPMDMYISRFALFPLAVLFWSRALSAKKIFSRPLLAFLLANLIFAASFLTATIFFTLVLVLLLVSLAHWRLWRRSLVLFFLFLAINSFWLLPFVSYYSGRAKIVSRASTFVEANEIQLNHQPEVYSWLKVLTLYPVSFYTQSTNLLTNEKESLHPLAAEYSRSLLVKISLLALPLLALAGLGLAVFKVKKINFLWTGVLFAIALFLLRKEYPPFGFVYDFLGAKIPFFKIVFRFGAEKFSPLLLLASCLLAAITALFFFRRLAAEKIFWIKKLSPWLVLVCLAGCVYPFRGYFRGELVGPLLYSKIPSAYFDLAQKINKDPSFGRVVHFPEGTNSYWKSYSWGYLGSTFLGFMLDKPLLEKTFVPASLENDQALDAMVGLLDGSQMVSRKEELINLAKQFQLLLAKTQVKYVIWDPSVTPLVPLRNRVFWGDYKKTGSPVILDELVRQDKLEIAGKHDINHLPLIAAYGLNRTDNGKLVQAVKDEAVKTIILYRVKEEFSAAQSLPLAIGVCSDRTVMFPNLLADKNEIEADSNSCFVLPFYQLSSDLSATGNAFKLKTTLPVKEAKVSAFYRSEEEQQVAVKLVARRQNDLLTINLRQVIFPAINGQTFEKQLDEMKIPLFLLPGWDEPETPDSFLANWGNILPDKISSYRISGAGVAAPLPILAEGEEKEIGVFLAKSGDFSAKILAPAKLRVLSPGEFNLTENPNCFSDKYDNYQFRLEKGDGLTMTSQNGSVCGIADLSADFDGSAEYVEFGLNYRFSREEVGSHPRSDLPGSTILQQAVGQTVDSLTPANYFSICLLGGLAEECLNTHHTVLAQESGRLTVSSGEEISYPRIRLRLALPTLGEQKTTLKIVSLTEKKYRPVVTFSRQITVLPVLGASSALLPADSLNIELPATFSRRSYYHQIGVDALQTYNQPCPDGFRTTRISGGNTLFYSQQCQNGGVAILPFSSSSFLLWQADYSLLASKYPKMILANKLFQYRNEYLSLGRGYPDVIGFRTLQSADPPLAAWQKDKISQQARESLVSPKVQQDWTLIFPHPDFGDNEQKRFTIEQNSERQGLFTLVNMNMVELPGYWSNLMIENGNGEREYQIYQLTGLSQFLPSLLETKVAVVSSKSNNALLVLNQAYDPGWSVYRSSKLAAFLGLGKISSLPKVANGWANGWEISPKAFGGAKKVVFFYAPERLAALGWLITFLTAATACLKLVRLRSRKKL